MCANQARKLALEAGRTNPWTKRKFKAFLSRSVQPDELSVKDRVFHPLEALCPPPDKFSEALSNIYNLRSGNLHEGKLPISPHIVPRTNSKTTRMDDDPNGAPKPNCV